MRNRLLRSIPSLITGCGLFLFLALMLTFSAHAQTQITAGTVQGTVTDQAGAVVPGANVEVRNLETNLVRTFNTDEDGRFVALQLPPGHYTVTISKQGFATIIQQDFPLTVGETVPLNLSMKISQGAERGRGYSIPVVDTIKSESSTTSDAKAVSNGRGLGRK